MNQETVENTGKAPSYSEPRLDRGRTEVPRARGWPERGGRAAAAWTGTGSRQPRGGCGGDVA